VPAIRRTWSGGLAVTRSKSLFLAISAIAMAAGLAGCASAPPLSVEEHLFFDKATGSGILGPPGLRMQDFGYAPPVGRVYRLRPPSGAEEP
jgi:hypothetical protein